MLKNFIRRQLLISTAVALPLTMGAAAQTVEIHPDQLEGKSAECQALGQLVMDREEPVQNVSPEEVVAAINEDRVEECGNLQKQIADAGNAQQDAQESERLSEEVDLSEEATIEGEAEVTVPEPDVDVQVPAPNVEVTKQQPQVDIRQQGLEIELEQRQPQVAVEIPEVIVRVDIPAPRVYVLRSDPSVELSDPDPQIEVAQGEPRVSVTQGEPQLNVDLQLEEDGQAEEGNENRVMADGETQQQQQVEGDTEAVQSEPQVEVAEGEGEPRMTYEAGQPQLSYEPVQPQVSVMMSEQPSVEVQQSGEAEIILETPEEREQRRQQRQADATQQGEAENEQQNQQQAAMSDQTEQDTAAAGQTMTVNDLLDMTVVTAGGEDLGEPEAFIDINGETHLVVGSGGFLGIGEKEVPVPMSNVTLQGDRLVISSLTEEQIEAANDFDYDDDLELPDDQEIQLKSN